MEKLIKNRYNVEKKIGSGAYGKVFLVTDKKDESKLVFRIMFVHSIS
jgi:hypothetical protein